MITVMIVVMMMVEVVMVVVMMVVVVEGPTLRAMVVCRANWLCC